MFYSAGHKSEISLGRRSGELVKLGKESYIIKDKKYHYRRYL
jgi:hypothetical protein